MIAHTVLVAFLLAQAPVDGVLTRAIDRGPVKVTLEVSPAPARLSDLPRFKLTVDADQAVDVQLPAPAGEVGGFSVRTLREPRPESKDGRRVVTLELELEPLESGTLAFPALEVICVDRRAETLVDHAEGLSFTIATDPIELEVMALLPSEAPTLDQLRPPLGALRVEAPNETPWKWILAGAFLALLVALLIVRSRRKRDPSIPVGPPPTPEELARREFVALARGGSLGKGDLSGFFSELTLIVRRYIERTTGVAAPEQTTEEFLRAMRGHSSFDTASREKLKAFLEAADLVKFAGVRPGLADVEESFRRGQEFAGQKESIALGASVEATS